MTANEQLEGLVTCRAGLEQIVADELRYLGLKVVKTGKRAVFFNTDLAGIYRANMGLRCALNVLLPIRTFNARNYDMLYYQSRKTNWHKLFPVERTLRIDVNGGSDVLTHSAYVIHRVKDGIVDTFRKLTEGQRPSISKDEPDIHLVVHLEGTRVTLCLDTSGIPLFKRGYRTEHGGAPIKEDLAAGILRLSGWNYKTPVIDPMCGSGTFLFEAWMMACNRAPNLERNFAFQSVFNYDAELHEAEKQNLLSKVRQPEDFHLFGADLDPSVLQLLQKMARQHFPDIPLHLHQGTFQSFAPSCEQAFLVSNPPYGMRLGETKQMHSLYQDLGQWMQRHIKGGKAAVFSAFEGAQDSISLPTDKVYTLFNGAIEGRLLTYSL
jgi:putative N6-adenine-specific DNA methylase